MPDTYTGDTERLRSDLARCMRFIRAIPDDEMAVVHEDGWRKELRAIKREIHA